MGVVGMVRAAAIAASAVATLPMASPAASANAFNLNCSGSLRTLMPYLLKDETEPYSKTYRIDLDAKKWCDGECKAQFDIAEVTPLAIILQDKNIDTPREHQKVRAQISRETGAEYIYANSGVGRMRMTMVWDGRCEKAAFSGFPRFETKF